jgi:hypothetical protein
MNMQHTNIGNINPRELLQAAKAIAAGQGLGIDRVDAFCVARLGRRLVRTQEYRITDKDEERSIVPCHPAPPTIVCALDDEAFTPGSMAEANWRLASMLAITVLVGDSSDLAAVPAAIWFAKDTQRAFRTVDPLVAEIDFLSWCDLGRDLSAWFDVRFTTSRQHMI